MNERGKDKKRGITDPQTRQMLAEIENTEAELASLAQQRAKRLAATTPGIRTITRREVLKVGYGLVGALGFGGTIFSTFDSAQIKEAMQIAVLKRRILGDYPPAVPAEKIEEYLTADERGKVQDREKRNGIIGVVGFLAGVGSLICYGANSIDKERS